MNDDQAKGALKNAQGKLQEQGGKAAGSDDQKAKGASKQAEGKLQAAYGNIKDALKNSRHQ